MKQEKFTVAEAQEMSVRISYSTGTSAVEGGGRCRPLILV